MNILKMSSNLNINRWNTQNIGHLQGGRIDVYFGGTRDDTLAIEPRHLAPARPIAGERATVVYGADRDVRGVVVSVSNADAVLRLETSGELKPYPQALLCKSI